MKTTATKKLLLKYGEHSSMKGAAFVFGPHLTTLVFKQGHPVMIGVHVGLDDGDVVVTGVQAPKHDGSTGRVYVQYADGSTREFFPSVVGAEWRRAE